MDRDNNKAKTEKMRGAVSPETHTKPVISDQKRMEAYLRQIRFFESQNTTGAYDAILDYLRDEYYKIRKSIAQNNAKENAKNPKGA